MRVVSDFIILLIRIGSCSRILTSEEEASCLFHCTKTAQHGEEEKKIQQNSATT